MSEETEQVGETSTAVESPLDYLEKWYHVPVLAALFGYMVWVRSRAYENYVNGDKVYFAGNDAYYHYRQVEYTVRHWPNTMPYDPWSYYPYGTFVGQFGTLFDQVIATVALIVGLGSPSEQTIAMTVLFAPAVIGAAVLVPVYYIGDRLGGRLAGVFAAAVLALLPGSFLRRSLVGFADHHIAEALLQATVIFLAMVAITVAEQEKPVFEQFVDRDWDGLRKPLKWSSLLGLAIGLYVWTWPPGIIIVGILGTYFLAGLTLNYLLGRSPDHLASVGVVSTVVASVVMLVRFQSTGFSTTIVSPLQILLALAVGAGCAFMAWLARAWSARDAPRSLYPVAVFGILAVLAGLVSVAAPSLWDTIVTNIVRVFGLSSTDTGRTVAEVQSIPLDSVFGFMESQYGLAYVTAFLGWTWLASHVAFSREEYRGEHLLLVVWTVFLVLMALTQRRFNYYLALAVVAMNAWVFGQVVELLSVPTSVEGLTDLKGYQVMTIFAVVLVVVVPLTGPLAVTDTAAQVGNETNNGPGSVTTWTEGLDWMEENTPESGNYAGAGNEMALYGTYKRTDDYEYPEGTYGVMSWWDYGHWITVEGERMPNANPFQEGPRPASTFLQSTNETRAELVLEALPALDDRDERVYELSNEELRQVIAEQNSQEQSEDTRYVVIDDQMAGRKFLPITRWTDDEASSYFTQQPYNITTPQGTQSVPLPTTTQKYQDTMLSELYFQDAGSLEHYRLVNEVNTYSIVGGLATSRDVRPRTQLVLDRGWNQPIRNETGAAVSGSDPANISAQVRSRRGGVLPIGAGQYVYDAEVESRVKTFERVDGATLTGSLANASNGTQVAAVLTLETSHGRQFTYLQTARTGPDGSFEMTVPYSTTHELGVDEGYTNESVTAVGNYTFLKGSSVQFARQIMAVRGPLQPGAGQGNATVPETAVVNGETVDVGTVEFPQPDSGNETGGNGTDGSGDGSGTDGSGDGSNSTDTNTTGAVAPLSPDARVAAP